MASAPPLDYDTIRGSSLIIPAVTIGNIPQLATDLLLHNLGFAKVAALPDHFLYPYVSGIDHLPSEKLPRGISLALEVFYSEKYNVTLLQQRSPIIAGMSKQHIQQILLPFIAEASFTKIMVLASADAGLEEKRATMRLFSDSAIEEMITWMQISPRAEPDYLRSESLDSLPKDLDKYTEELISKIQPELEDGTKKPSIAASVLVSYVYEGDNTQDAFSMASAAAKVFGIGSAEWKIPVSWMGVYGDRPIPVALEEGLYG
ncbi:putative proteasome assembly chaperone [Clavispora lusitaniae]|uniref:Proteasome assembly chaperone n=1 Tax=Clavispora lusitaniae TaxID=36911 RepID=A0ACD0WSA9_CLALS|nr:putative proteasome assembly chaperone [Clavispora lusitaniae]QFZ36071.1 putative proteasome assembly chaperone [Clavispora lusitaniae]QFZ41755.1 putative proteasome assembly chaperone [Clavispora lusitaniae]QFZ47431.1 putative proteasome assembly chaperone [Clavispora lusitaniae]QFZ53110.1 putative proteasome assembly chaperone [Clavispora lusitaniae]